MPWTCETLRTVAEPKPEPQATVVNGAPAPALENLLTTAERLMADGKPVEAMACLTRLGPDHLQGGGRLLMARILADQGRLTEARSWAEQAAATSKTNARAHLVHATILQELSEWSKAEAAVNRALFLEPNLVMGQVAAAQIATRVDKPQASARHYAIALSLLQKLSPQTPVPESDGMTAGLLTQLIERSSSPAKP